MFEGFRKIFSPGSKPTPTPSLDTGTGPSPKPLPHGNVPTQRPPQTREELHEFLGGMMEEHGSDNALSALEKTNYKYLQAKQQGIGESPEAEKTAVQGMHALVTNNESTVLGNTWADHYKTQQLDQQFHQSVTGQSDNPYGGFTTALTNFAPLSMRTLYSGMTPSIPRFRGVFDSSSDK